MEKIVIKKNHQLFDEKPVYLSVTPTVHYGAPAPSPEPVEKLVNFKKISTVAPTLPSLG